MTVVILPSISYVSSAPSSKSELFDNLSKDYIIVTFLALLEMVKSDEINIIQEGNFSDIYITGGNK